MIVINKTAKRQTRSLLNKIDHFNPLGSESNRYKNVQNNEKQTSDRFCVTVLL